MKYADVVRGVNALLDGEMLPEYQVIPLLDAVIDDINEALSSSYYTFTEARTLPGADGTYTFFPDMYIRSVVCVGAAYKFYLTEEEGEMIAGDFAQKYQTALFTMKRDWLEQVPALFRDKNRGFMNMPSQEMPEQDPEHGYFGAMAWVDGVFVGPPGPRGPQGEQGGIGPRGERGHRGYQGEQGPQGEIGPRGNAFVYSDFTEEQLEGLIGPVGPEGPRGLRGFKGDLGEKGDTGPQGPIGVTGIQGPVGDDGASAYDLAVLGGYTGSYESFMAILATLSPNWYGTDAQYAALTTIDPHTLYFVVR